MATSDPRYIIKDIIDAITLTKDDDLTPATILHIYERGPEDLKQIFFDEDYDVLVTYGEPQVDSARNIGDVPVYYIMRYPVTVVTVDKHVPPLGALVCTASIMQAKARTAIRIIVEASAQSTSGDVPAYTLVVTTEKGKTEWGRGFNVWSTKYTLRYTAG